MRRRTPANPRPEIDCDWLLNGEPTWPQVVEFFKIGSFDSEEYLVAAIKKHLRTTHQRQWLALADISIEDVLNGRYGADMENAVRGILDEWNTKLGFTHFQ